VSIDADFPAHLERIREFLRLPSVSAQDGDLRETAAAGTATGTVRVGAEDTALVEGVQADAASGLLEQGRLLPTTSS
jgi:hypothetical protein